MTTAAAITEYRRAKRAEEAADAAWGDAINTYGIGAAEVAPFRAAMLAAHVRLTDAEAKVEDVPMDVLYAGI